MNERTFEHLDVVYQWCGGFGAIFKSWERGVKRGDVRYILDRMFYAYLVYPKWLRRSEVCWTLTGEFTVEDIRQVQRQAFGVIAQETP